MREQVQTYSKNHEQISWSPVLFVSIQNNDLTLHTTATPTNEVPIHCNNKTCCYTEDTCCTHYRTVTPIATPTTTVQHPLPHQIRKGPILQLETHLGNSLRSSQVKCKPGVEERFTVLSDSQIMVTFIGIISPITVLLSIHRQPGQFVVFVLPNGDKIPNRLGSRNSDYHSL